MEEIQASINDPLRQPTFWPVVFVRVDHNKSGGAASGGHGWWPATLSRPNVRLHALRHLKTFCGSSGHLLPSHFFVAFSSIDDIKKRSKRGELFVEFLDGTYQWICDVSAVVVLLYYPFRSVAA